MSSNDIISKFDQAMDLCNNQKFAEAEVLLHEILKEEPRQSEAWRALAEHTVTYYASSLAITPRYLNLIVNRLTSNESAKDIIDQRLILEIKSLLSYTDKSIQQIAIMLHFPDVSYLGRFFRRHTGMNASEYREKHNSRG